MTTTPSKTGRASCSDHCATCGRHFTGTEAFDWHRAGDYATERRCLDPHDVPRLAVATATGRCEISGEVDDNGAPLTVAPVNVWGSARAYAQRPALASVGRTLAPSGAQLDPTPVLAFAEAS